MEEMEAPTLEALNDRIRQLMDERGHRREWLAGVLGLTPGMVTHVMKGRARFKREAAELALKAILEPNSTIEGTPAPEPALA